MQVAPTANTGMHPGHDHLAVGADPGGSHDGHLHPDGTPCAMAMVGADAIGATGGGVDLAGIVAELERAVRLLEQAVTSTFGGGDAAASATQPAQPPATTPSTTPAAATASSPGRDAMVQQLRELFERRGSPMAASTEALVDSALRHRVDPRLMAAIAGQESEFGTTNPGSLRNNPFGFLWNGGLDSPFESWEAGYERVATRLAEMIHEQGFTSVLRIAEGDPNVRNDGYCEVGASNDPTGLNNHWVGGVGAMYAQLGGNPDDVRI